MVSGWKRVQCHQGPSSPKVAHLALLLLGALPRSWRNPINGFLGLHHDVILNLCKSLPACVSSSKPEETHENPLVTHFLLSS